MTTQDIKPWYKQSTLWLIPNKWDCLELKNVVDILDNKRKPFNSEERKGKKWDIPYYWANWIVDYINEYIFDDDLILIAEDGWNFSDYQTKPIAYRISWKARVNNHVHVLKAKSQFNQNYIFYSLEHKNILLQLNWGTRSKLNRKELEKIEIVIPSLPEQEAIANILWKVDENIEKTQNMIEKLELRNKGLEQKLLTWKVRLKWFSWEFKKLSADKIFKSVSIKNLPDEELLSATQEQWIIPRSMLEWRVTMPTSEAKSYKLVVPWNFVISLRSFQWWLEYSKYRWIVSPAYTVLEPIIPICDDYYKYYFKSYDFIGHLSIAVIWIRDWKQISFDDFCTLNLPCPDLEEQKAIANVLNKATEQLDLYRQKLEKLQELKKWLMQQLLTWKVRVKEFRN